MHLLHDMGKNIKKCVYKLKIVLISGWESSEIIYTLYMYSSHLFNLHAFFQNYAWVKFISNFQWKLNEIMLLAHFLKMKGPTDISVTNLNI